MDYEKFLIEKYNKISLSVEEVAQELNVTKRMITDRVSKASADIPPFRRIGKKTVFPIKPLAKFMEQTERSM